MAIFMAVGLLLYHSGMGPPPLNVSHFFMIAPNGAGWFIELQVFYLMVGVMVGLQGQGRYGLGIGGRWN